MKYTKYFLKTSKENPSDETARNAELLIRGGFIHKEMAGVYSYLPMGLRVLEKIKNIVREEMNDANAIEMLMSSLCPKENWVKTNRWDTVDVLYKMELPNGKEVALCPTQEEIVTPIVQNFCRSYKDLPTCVYHIQTKFRNEARAKSGLLRGREFLMKDAYSFHTTEENFEEYYQVMRQAYHKVYDRLGIGEITKYVAADGGDFGEFSHEFQTISEIGEDDIYIDTVTGDAYNKEIATGTPDKKNTDKTPKELKIVEAKRDITVKANAELHGVANWQILKSIIFFSQKSGFVMVCLRGDLSVNPLLASKFLKDRLEPATADQLKELNLPQGFISPYKIKEICPKITQVLADESCRTVVNFITSPNENEKDILNFNMERDGDVDHWGNFAVPTDKFLSPAGNPMEIKAAVEVGNIFPLSSKFSKAFKYEYTDDTGKNQPVIMGCYGIGVSRIMGVLAELFADEKGLIWPKSVAPFQVYLSAIGKNDNVYEKAEEIYINLKAQGVEVFYDDRKEKKIGPGVKFGDFELLGIPYQIVLSEKLIEAGNIELWDRSTGDRKEVQIEMINKDLFV